MLHVIKRGCHHKRISLLAEWTDRHILDSNRYMCIFWSHNGSEKEKECVREREKIFCPHHCGRMKMSEHIFVYRLYMYHFVSRIMHFIFKCHSLTINFVFCTYFFLFGSSRIAHDSRHCGICLLLAPRGLTIYYFIGFPIYRSHVAPFKTWSIPDYRSAYTHTHTHTHMLAIYTRPRNTNRNETPHHFDG